jgi:hypothetical protein
MFGESTLTFRYLLGCERRQVLRFDAIPKILCKLNAVCRTEFKQLCPQ